MPRICKSSMMDTVPANLFITLRFRLDGSLRSALADYKVPLKLPPQVAITTSLPYRQISMLPIGRRFGCRNRKAPEEFKTAGWRKFMGPSFESSFCMEDVQINVD
jgi:hypothetical protein